MKQQPTDTTTAFHVDRVCILALGLIGGSLAAALKARGFAGQVVAWGRRESTLQRGLELGIIDAWETDLEAAVRGSDIVVIATPTQIAEQMLDRLAALTRSGVLDTATVLTDVASVKGNLLAAARRAFGSTPSNLVLGHPIAGSEKSGVDAATADLFVNHKVIITPCDETDRKALQRVRGMWAATGAELAEMPVAEHDEVLAATSHLPHLLAYALVDALSGMEERQNIFRYAAGGFRDFTRIASSDPTMWHEISLANSDAILAMLDRFSDQLQDLRRAIAERDGDALMQCFTRAKTARDAFAQLLARQNQATITDE